MPVTKNGFEVTLKAGSWNPAVPVNDITTNGVGFYAKPPKEKGIYSFEFSLCKYPTSNCQVSSIGRMDNIVNNLKSREDIFEVLTEAYKIINIPMLLAIIDCKSYYSDRVEKNFKIIHKNAYVSSNGSEMTMYLVDLKVQIPA